MEQLPEPQKALNINSTPKHHSGAMAWFTRNPVAANLMMLFILLLGLKAALTIRTEFFPEFPTNKINITVPFLGGTPDEVEEGVAIKIEEVLSGLNGIEKINSEITSTQATITVTAIENYSIDKLKDDIKGRIDTIPNFPDSAETPTIIEQTAEQHIINIEVFSAQANEKTLKETARNIRDELLALPDINKVQTSGARDYEISIEVSEVNLRRFNLTFAEVAQAIQKNSINLTGGSLQTEYGKINIRTQKQSYYGADFEKLVIRSDANGGVITLKDIASINDAYTEDVILSEYQGQPSVQLKVKMVGDTSITQASEQVREALSVIERASWLPTNVQLGTWYDQSSIIRDRLSLMSSNAISGMFFVLVLLTLFLNIRIALWVAIGIPISFAGALYVIGPDIMNNTLNVLSTFGFIVVLGIVVDDAIVIGESIYTAKEHAKEGEDPIEVTIQGAAQVAVPATFGVLTTVAAFLPLTMIKSQMGDAFGAIAVIVIACLLFSLIESKWILPAHLSKIQLKKTQSPQWSISALWNRFQSSIDRGLKFTIAHGYIPLAQKVVTYRYASLCAFIALLIFVIGLIPAGIVKSAFFPDIEQETATLDFGVKTGYGIDYTHDIARYIAQTAVESGLEIQEKYGSPVSPVESVKTLSLSEKQGKVSIALVKDSEREHSVQEVVDLWRKNVGIPNGIKYIELKKQGPGGNDPAIKVNIAAPDIATLRAAAEDFQNKLRTYQGVLDIKSSLDDTDIELQVTLKPEGYALGLRHQDIAQQLRYAVYGFEAQRIQRGKDEVKVRVRYPKQERDSLTDLQEVRIRTASGEAVPLSLITTIEKVDSVRSISRVDGSRIVTIQAETDDKITSGGDILRELQETYFKSLEANYPNLSIATAGQAEEQMKAQNSLVQGFLLSLMLIYMLLAIPLKSYFSPFIIMVAIPFGIIGAILGHLVIDLKMSIMSFFGILALSGVVVNDSLVMVSRYNDLRNMGMSYKQAVVNAGASRFRAILLTSLTTFFGLLPVISETSMQAKFLVPMAVSLGFGILFATIITLFIIPVLLGLKHDISHLFGFRKTKTSSHSTYKHNTLTHSPSE